MKKDKWIFQKHSNDCGIAALAMLFGTSYTFMRRKVLEQAESRSEPFDGTTSTYVHGVALKLGRRIIVQRVPDFPVQTLAQNVRGYPAVLVCPALDGSEDFHAVYWDGKRVYDPSPGKRYGMAGAKALKSLHEVWILN